MITSTTNQVAGATTTTAATTGRGMDSLGQGDFLRLLTVQMQQQDPFDPVDNKEMLAQMAQFACRCFRNQCHARADRGEARPADRNHQVRFRNLIQET